jgi:pilus assembly protein CpaC
VNRVALGLSVVLLLLGGGRLTPSVAAGRDLVRIDVTIGKSQVLELTEPLTRISVTNPAIADVFVITPTQLVINGKAVGVTSLVVFYPSQTLFFDLVVQTDLGLLRDRLKEVAPREDIVVQPAQDAILLSGKVSSQHLISAAQDVAGVFAPKGKVINLLTLAEVKAPQVMLQVQVAEATREALRELGFNIRALGSTFQGGAFPGVPFVPPLGTVGVVQSAIAGLRGSPSTEGAGGPDFPLNGSNFFLSSGPRDYAAVIRALASRNLIRTLAKPNLVTESGKQAKFLSGGEFPVPIAQREGVITVEFKEFGIGLVFTPLVLDGETINLTVKPEVSSLDFSQGLILAGFRIPVIRKNEAFTNINVRDGESFAIAGLINNEVRQVVDKIPVLGDIPILGALFRSTRFRNNETELLFLVTVKQVKPDAPGSAATPDPRSLMEPRPAEKQEFTLMPGTPGVGEIVERPFGASNLPLK